jgi:CheY-like chemotaxis protein
MGNNMTKIMLVEDDKSLREIYGVRLLAEGYDIVSAGDGEEALAMAIKERPKLIVTDVMMPKISGFDMLDILRSTTETKDIKIIMMTALSSEDQRARGEQMGADRYLVKSQVGIEDVVRVVHEVLGDGGAKPTAPTPAAAAPAPTVAAATPTAPTPPAAAPAPASPAPTAPPADQPHTMPPIASSTGVPASTKQRVIQPISPNQPGVNIDDLLNRELARESGTPGLPPPPPPPPPPPADEPTLPTPPQAPPAA